jgi:hypothetical protein
MGNDVWKIKKGSLDYTLLLRYQNEGRIKFDGPFFIWAQKHTDYGSAPVYKWNAGWRWWHQPAVQTSDTCIPTKYRIYLKGKKAFKNVPVVGMAVAVLKCSLLHIWVIVQL